MAGVRCAISDDRPLRPILPPSPVETCPDVSVSHFGGRRVCRSRSAGPHRPEHLAAPDSSCRPDRSWNCAVCRRVAATTKRAVDAPRVGAGDCAHDVHAPSSFDSDQGLTWRRPGASTERLERLVGAVENRAVQVGAEILTTAAYFLRPRPAAQFCGLRHAHRGIAVANASIAEN